MISLDLKAVKQSILDRERIMGAMERANSRALAKFGAFVRQRAKTSLRKRKSVSEPGSPPSSHAGLIRDYILFLVENGRNVVIGPMKLNSTRSEKALAALEHGGPTVIEKHGKKETVTLQARPFMRPAFDAELAKAPELWKDSLT